MQVLRLYDPDRRPPNWSDMVAPTSFVAFATAVDTGSPTDADGAPFARPEAATCLVFDSLASARAYCESQVAERPSVRFDIFDARGRVDDPLLVVVDPARSRNLEGRGRGMFWRRSAALVMIAAAGPLVWYDYATARGTLVLPTFLGISMAIAGIRLLFMNLIVREAQRRQQERLARHD
jgi:hypothetical protein